MDSQFPSGVVYAPSLPPSRQLSAPSSSNAQPYQLPQPSLSNSQTLPSLQSQSYSQGFGNDPFGQRTQTSQPSFAPANTPTASHAATYPAYTPAAMSSYPEQQNSYTQPTRSFQSSSAYSSQPPTTQGYQTYTSSLPVQARRPELRPMPAGGLNEQPSLSSYQKATPTPNSAALQGNHEPQPTHVVGSQGRRGILPSAVGRPPAIGGGNLTGQKSASIPPKDAEGKFPCPYCSKNYLHAKHLKRHLLRHTGIRPYSCGLCKDTFSRSDILKRHFQKCSVRRGNPSGASHLTHSRANRKAKLEPAEETTISGTNSGVVPGQSLQHTGFPGVNLQNSLGLSSLHLSQSSYSEDHHGLPSSMSHSSSINQASHPLNTGNRGPTGAPTSAGFDTSGFSNPTGHVTPDSVTTSGAATPYPYPQDSRPTQFSSDGSFNHASNGQSLDLNGTSRPPPGSGYPSGSLPQIVESSQGHRNDLDWLFQPGSQGEFGNHQIQSGIETSHQHVKSEPEFPFSLAPEYAPFLQTKV